MSCSCRNPSIESPTLAELNGYAVCNVSKNDGQTKIDGLQVAGASRAEVRCNEFERILKVRQGTTGQKRVPGRAVSLCLTLCIVFAGSLSMQSPATAFDGKPADHDAIQLKDLSPREALRNGARQYYSGDKVGALVSLRYAAENGQPMAAWKLGEMYAKGDGVQEDDIKAFQYYSQVVRQHGDNAPNAPDAPFVASAFVALGTYYLHGITDAVPKNISRARQIFTHAASYFGDPDAQYELGCLYQGNSDRMAVRWFNLAALKGHVGAQARLGETLYNMGHSDLQKARGLMWMTVARKQAPESDAAWINEMHERYFGLSSEAIRDLSRSMADTWMAHNRPDMVTAQTQTQPVQ